MKDFHTKLVDNDIVTITLCEVERPTYSSSTQSTWLGQSSFFLGGPAVRLAADDTGLAFGKTLCVAAAELICGLDLSDHPDVAAIDMPQDLTGKITFSRRAGCTCGCSPGFPTFTRIWVTTRDGRHVYVDVHVTIEWDSVIAPAVPAATAATAA